MVRGVRIGALAQAMYSAEARLRRAERDVTDVLNALFPGSATRPGWRGWKFDGAQLGALALQVYEVITPSPAAIAALHRAGFSVVTVHGHTTKEFLSCACIPQIARKVDV